MLRAHRAGATYSGLWRPGDEPTDERFLLAGINTINQQPHDKGGLGIGDGASGAVWWAMIHTRRVGVKGMYYEYGSTAVVELYRRALPPMYFSYHLFFWGTHRSQIPGFASLLMMTTRTAWEELAQLVW